MAFKGMVQIDKKDIWTIPNIITYFRILCVPAFVAMMAIAGVRADVKLFYGALAVFVVAAASDMLDGYLARKYNWISGIGMALDPVADKLMHISVLACLCFCTGLTPLGQMTVSGVMYPDFVANICGGWYVHYAFVILIFAKELVQSCCAPIAMKNNAQVEANMFGKIGSFTISMGVILAFFHPYVYLADWGILAMGIAISYVAAFTYLKDVTTQAKLVKMAKADGTYIEGETGRDIQRRIAAAKQAARDEELKAAAQKADEANSVETAAVKTADDQVKTDVKD